MTACVHFLCYLANLATHIQYIAHLKCSVFTGRLYFSLYIMSAAVEMTLINVYETRYLYVIAKRL